MWFEDGKVDDTWRDQPFGKYLRSYLPEINSLFINLYMPLLYVGLHNKDSLKSTIYNIFDDKMGSSL